MKLKSLLAVVASAAFAVCASADTWYADASKEAGTGDGTSPATAFHTIQEAVNAASADDTVFVAEGTYDEGTTNAWSYSHSWFSGYQQTRVLVTKKLTIVASGEKSKTVILGDYGTVEKTTNGTAIQYYTDCIACMVVGSGVTGVRVEGITFERGSSHQSAGASSLAAGGLCCYNTTENTTFQNAFTAVNCDFIGCSGRGAGGICGGTAIRCGFRGCVTNFRATSAYRSRLFNCISRDNAPNSSSSADFVNCLVVNCTIVNNFGKFGLARSTDTDMMPEGFGTAYNTVCYGNVIRYQDEGKAASPGYAHNVVCDLNRAATKTVNNVVVPRDTNEVDFIEGSTDVVYLEKTAADMSTACVCPATLDFRPVKGGCLDGKGKQYDALAFVPAEELKLDFNGNAFDGTLPIGAILPSAEVNSGVLTLIDTYFNVDGHDLCTYPAYVQSAVWPSQVKLRGSTRQTYKFLGTMGPFRTYRGRYDYVLQTLPPKTKADGTPYAMTSGTAIMQYANELFVGNAKDQDNASDSNAGTAEAPFKTISKAIDATGDKTTVIHVRPGTYSIANGETGGVWTDNEGVKGVVSLPKGKPTMMIVADEGPDVTFIEGQADPETVEETVLPGCGPNAYRCVILDNAVNGVVVGFTLRNGYASCRSKSTSASAENFGSAVLTGGANQYLYDCVITGCHGNIAVYQGVYQRCVFRNNVDCQNGVGYGNCYFGSCVFDGNCPTADRILYNNCYTVNCTFYERQCKSSCYMQNINGWMQNCAIDTTGEMLNFTETANPVIASVVYAAADYLATGTAVVHENPYFTAPWNGDYRIHEPSAAKGIGLAQDPTGKIDTTKTLQYLKGDLLNRPLVAADGSINAGALAETTPAYDVYVDAENGNDANDGLSETAAKKTLQAAVDVRVPANCRVVALPGVYNEGSGLHVGKSFNNGYGPAQPSIRSRVVVPEGKTLISRGGPQVTIVEGEPSEGSEDAYGRGPKAIRGAFLEKNATLSGFTVRYGHSDYYRKGDGTGGTHDTSYQDDLFAGGVLGRSKATNDQLGGAVVENCILTENYAPNGGAGCLVTFRNCIVSNNVGASYGAFFRHGEAYGCYIARNRGQRVGDCVFNFVNCTFEDNLNAGSDTPTQLIANMAAGGKLWNLVSITGTLTDSFGGADVRNVVLSKGTKPGCTGTAENVNTNFTYSELREMFADGRPVTPIAPTVDQGLADAEALLAATDVVGNPRVQNGTIDIGAFEYDWRGDYAKAIGRRVTVTEASPSVVMTDGHPLMRDGTALAATVAARSSVTEGDYIVRAALTGNGKMLVYLNGELLGELTASGELRFTNNRATNDLRFEYAGEGSACVAKVAQELGALLIVR